MADFGTFPACAGAVFQQGSSVIVKDFSSTKRTKIVYTGTLGTNDVAALQYAQDHITGSIYVGPGTWTWNSLETLLVKNSMFGAGIDKTILKAASGLNDNARTLVEMDNGASLSYLTVDGNSSGNNKPWTTFAGTPFAQGIYTGKYLTNSNVKDPAAGCTIRDVKVINTLRTNLVMCGNRNVAENVTLSNSLMDHQLYFSGAYQCRVSGAFLSGGSDGASVVFGTDATEPANDCILEGAFFHDITLPCYFSTTTTSTLIQARTDAGVRNTIRGIRANLGDLTGLAQYSPIIINSWQHDFLAEDVNAYIAKGNAAFYIYAKGPGATLPICEQTYRNVHIYLAIDARGGGIYMCESIDLSRLNFDDVRLVNASATAMSGLRLIATNNSIVANLNHVYFYLYSTGKTIVTGTAATKRITFENMDINSNISSATLSGDLAHGVGILLPGEIRTYSGSITTLTENAFNSLDNPFGQAVRLLSLDVYISTKATSTEPNIDCGIGSSATADYTTLFDDLPGETVGFYRSTIATPGTQTVPQLWESGSGNRYLNMSIKDAAATGMVATYVATVMGI